MVKASDWLKKLKNYDSRAVFFEQDEQQQQQ
jgi:hypothetical protein